MKKLLMIPVVLLTLAACDSHTKAAVDGAIVGGVIVCIATGC